MAGELNLEKVRKVLDDVFDLELNVAEIYLVIDSLSRVLINSVREEDRVKVLKALLTTTILGYFKAQGREDIAPSKAGEAVDELLRTIASW
ncbi:MAG: hypothetical protein B6U69_01440 [Thermofilum sp. ex4484_15]|nr:MAG: hypothetical protein B6U69_01440 [Thermofilum sp. ex4484_15]